MRAKIRIYKRPRLKAPNFIAAWPGMGSVAIRAAIYLKDKLKAQEFAVVEPEGFFHPQEAFIQAGIISKPWFPKGRFYFWKNKGDSDLIIFISEAQPALEKGYIYIKELLSLAKEFKARRIFTFAAMPVAIDHFSTPQVFMAVTEKSISEWFSGQGIKMMRSGQISGMNGLMLAVAKEQGFKGCCLLGQIPLYTIQIENPKASLVVLEVLAQLLKLEIDFSDLNKQTKFIEDEIEKLIDYIKVSTDTAGPIGEEEIERIKKGLESFTKLPESAKLKIEQLFEQTKKNVGKANELKTELDKWNIYKEYEDRFLDLFKRKEKKDN